MRTEILAKIDAVNENPFQNEEWYVSVTCMENLTVRANTEGGGTAKMEWNPCRVLFWKDGE